MTNRIDQYIQAATRNNTRRSYQSAVEHYEGEWGGLLPATAEQVAQYLAHYADSLTTNTLRTRLAGLAQWHLEQGFADPTKAPLVKKVLKGIKALHPVVEKQAKPLLIEDLNRIIDAADRALAKQLNQHNQIAARRLVRNKALILIGFWRGFRGDELSRLRVEHIEVIPEEGMRIFVAHSKGDRQNLGQYFMAPALTKLCPVRAYLDWLQVSGLGHGPVFRGIDRWGNTAETHLNSNSVVAILREMLNLAGVENPNAYSSHSLRRGFAYLANNTGWDVKSLMSYVGWKDMKSALRYIDSNESYAKQKLESSLKRLS